MQSVGEFCPGREYFEAFVPFGSEKNKCPFGLDSDCHACKFYRE
jgi:hypothetical protein